MDIHTPLHPDRNLAMELVRATEAAAIRATPFIGKGDKNAADGAAVDAMRAFLSTVEFDGQIVIGEGEKDNAPMLYNGEKVGTGRGPACDIAVDPVDGTSLTAAGRQNAISVIAVSDKGTMLDASSVFYMNKLVAGPEGVGVVDIRKPIGENIRAIAKAKGKPVEDLKSLGKYFKGQNAWVQGQGDPNQRLDLLASEDRMKVLRGPKSKEGQVVSAMVMSTILGREVAYKDVDDSKYKLVFNLGTETRAGYIKIKQGEKELYKIEFKSPKDLSAEEITHFRNTFSSLKAQEHVEEIRNRAASALKTSGLPPEIQSTYHKTLREATEGLSERAAKAIKENTTQYNFYRDLNELNKAKKGGAPALGFFRLEPSKGVGKGSLHLDSFNQASDTFPTLSAAQASSFARLGLANVRREYPHLLQRLAKAKLASTYRLASFSSLSSHFQ